MSESRCDELTNASCQSQDPAGGAEGYCCQSVENVSQLSILSKNGAVIPMTFPTPVDLHAHSVRTPDCTKDAQSSTGFGADTTPHTNASQGNSQVAGSSIAASRELAATPTASPTIKALYYEKGRFGTDHKNKFLRDPHRLYLYDQGPSSAYADFDVTTNGDTGQRQLSAFVSLKKEEYENGRPITVRVPFEPSIRGQRRTELDVRVVPTGDGKTERWFAGAIQNRSGIPGTDRMIEKWEGPTVVSFPLELGTARRLLANPAPVTSEA